MIRLRHTVCMTQPDNLEKPGELGEFCRQKTEKNADSSR
jgi:hypothetical protein